jgi:hypothetical protein
MGITSDPIQDRMGLWSRKCHRFLIAGPFNLRRFAGVSETAPRASGSPQPKS